jgi:hypothetical protein
MWWQNETCLTASREYGFVQHFILLQSLTTALLAVRTTLMKTENSHDRNCIGWL